MTADQSAPADVAKYPANFRASAAKLDGNPHDSFLAGVRHGYLMAADAMDEMAAELAELRARDEVAEAVVQVFQLHPNQAERLRRSGYPALANTLAALARAHEDEDGGQDR